MKKCYKCGEEKELVEFSNKAASKDGKSSRCKTCTRDYTKKHYMENKQYYKNKRDKHRNDLKEWYVDYKTTLSCKNCTENRHWVLDFHHRDPEEKEGNLGEVLFNGGKKKFLEEVEKCDVLCSNCHRDLHYQLKNNTYLEG